MSKPPNSAMISSFFLPVKKPEEGNTKFKIPIANALKSANAKAAPFSSKHYQSPKGPFKLSSPSTDKLADQIAQVKIQLPSLRDLNTSSNSMSVDSDEEEIDRIVMGNEEEEEEAVESEQDSEEEMNSNRHITRRVLRKRKPIQIQDFDEDEDNDDEEEEEEEEVEPRFKRHKSRRTINEEDNDDEDDDGDEDYEGPNITTTQKYNGSDDEDTSVKRISRVCPEYSLEDIRTALLKTGSSVKAMSYLIQQEEMSVINIEDNGNDVDNDVVEFFDDNKTREEEANAIDNLVLKMFNTATSTEIQEMTGCNVVKADIIMKELRPFENINDLENKLRSTKGLSVKYKELFEEMVQGYYKVDTLILEIEKKGARLRSILNIWQGISNSRQATGKNTPKSNQDDDDDDDDDGNEDKPDEKAGTHMMHLDVNPSIDQTSQEYKDAMDGYISHQPNYVNKEFTLKDYQILGVNWMLLLYRKGISGILADEMGLGKTAQVISFLGRLYELGEEGPHLVIVPSSTIENWLREFKRFCPTLNVRLYHGTVTERFYQRDEFLKEPKEFQVLVTTYNVATSNKDDRTFLRQLRCASMILDEGHMIKNCTSARYINLMKIRTRFRLLLTGTPLQNNLQELVSLLMFIMPDTFSEREEEIRSIFKIRTTTAVKGGHSNNDRTETAVQVLSRERIQRAKQMMTPFVLRRKKVDVLKDLPQKKQVIERCIMTPNQRQLYSDILLKGKKSFEEQQQQQQQQQTTKTAMNQQFESMSNIVIHLRKAADHPLLFRNIYHDDLLRVMAKEIMAEVKYWDANQEYIYEDMTVMSDFELNNLCKEHKKISHHQLKNEEWMDSGKVAKLQEILPACRARKEKVLIFSQFTRMLDILELVLKTLKVTYLRLDGETKVMERQQLIDDFNTNDSIEVFLLSTKAGGFGINLTSANVVVLYDLDFNPQNDKQAEDRAHRVGQTKDVRIIKLISQDSIEEYILKMADIKLRLDKRISSTDEDAFDDEQDPQEQKQSLQSMIREAFIQADKFKK